MKKIILSCLLITLFISSLALPAFSQTSRLMDEAGLLEADSANELIAELDRISVDLGCDVVVMTANSTGNKSADDYAMELYEQRGYSADGVMLFVDMDARVYRILATGTAIDMFTDAGISYIVELIEFDLREGFYSDAFTSFAKTAEDFIVTAQNGEPYDENNLPKQPFEAFYVFIISAVVGLIAALIYVLPMKAKLKSVVARNNASDYTRSGSLNLTDRTEFFLYSQITRTEKAPPPSSNNSGGMRTSSSGKSYRSGGGSF